MNSYRGPDRRRSARPGTGSPFDLSFAVALVALASAALLAALRVLPVSTAGPDGEDYLAFGTASILAVSALLLVARWRISRNPRSFWASITCGIVATIIVMRCVSSSDVVDGHRVRSLALGLGVAALVAGVRAVTAPDVRPPLRSGQVVASFGAAVLGVSTVSALSSAWNLELPAHDTADATVAPSIVLTAGWLVLSMVWLRRSRNDGDWTLAWMGLMALALALSELGVIAAVLDERRVPLGTLVLLFIGASCTGRGAARDLQIALDAQARELDETRETMGAADQQAQSARAAAEERAHEARNALQAVGGAIQTLERHHEQLDPEVRSKLADGIAFELERLQRLVDVDEKAAPPTLFRVEDALLPVVEGARALGLVVDLRMADDLVAIGNPMATAEVVQNLLVNAQRHAGGIDVAVEAAKDRDRVVVTVSDGGPGVPHGEREMVFGRRQCGANSTGQGFGLYVSRRLVRSQGGDLWVADRPGGGAVFGFDLAVASGSRFERTEAAGTRSSDAVDEVGDTVDAS